MPGRRTGRIFPDPAGQDLREAAEIRRGIKYVIAQYEALQDAGGLKKRCDKTACADWRSAPRRTP
jgi:uracil-DNA glycosylase